MTQYGFSPKTIHLDEIPSALFLLNIPAQTYNEYKAWRDRPMPKKVIINDPATVVFSKTAPRP